jgi:hypothetical protein
VELVPTTFYHTQNFRSWLEWFLSQREVEDHLASTFNRTSAAGQDMHSFHDSPAWTDLDNSKTKYHLVFGLYIDWFNPYMNKIAGLHYIIDLISP